ncbi:MAG: tRNA (adenine(22)-N(1))-methyltransferase [Enterococcus sp.]
MNEQELSRRLKRVGEFVPQGARLADIGSDHAYLPVALVLQEKISFAVAGEVVEGPYLSAQKQVRKSRVEEKITVRLANGLDAIEPTDEISAITIAGMGGTLIKQILEAGRANNRINGSERLILQPNVGERNVRLWLVQEGYQIIAEDILEENRKTYEIIVAEQQKLPKEYCAQELFFGPFLMQEKSAVFKAKWQREFAQREKVLAQLDGTQKEHQRKIQELKEQIKWIEEVLA